MASRVNYRVLRGSGRWNMPVMNVGRIRQGRNLCSDVHEPFGQDSLYLFDSLDKAGVVVSGVGDGGVVKKALCLGC